jgi:predicted GNAT family N-acyltransferase
MDGREGECTHFVAWNGARAEGCARLRRIVGGLKVERVAVLPALRERGLGRALMAAVEAEARSRGVSRLVLNAQSAVVGFYEKLGWTPVGDEFVEAGIPHRRMEKRIDRE